MRNFRSPDYLLKGSSDQEMAWKALRELQVFERLSRFDPVLAGTFPLDLAVEGSDLDIVCEVDDLESFKETCLSHYQDQKYFSLSSKEINGLATVIVRFEYDKMPLEIFGQSRPVDMQHAYRHLIVEWHLLTTILKGRASELRALKKNGFTTEEAFACLLLLKGDPYQGLLDLGQSLGLYS